MSNLKFTEQIFMRLHSCALLCLTVAKGSLIHSQFIIFSGKFGMGFMSVVVAIYHSELSSMSIQKNNELKVLLRHVHENGKS